MELNIFQTILRTISSTMKNPVIVILILFIAFAVFCIGWILAELIKERRHMKYSLPELLDSIKANKDNLQECIQGSGLLARQKEALLELTRHPDFSEEMLVSLADNIIEKEQSHYDNVLSATNLISKLAPMVGLLGTLIPLGPGIIALGQGDTQTLSESMLTAFDTTIAGLLAAGICLVIHTFRKHWYAGYMSDLETLVDSVVDVQLENAKAVAASGRTDGGRIEVDSLTENQQRQIVRSLLEKREKKKTEGEKKEKTDA
ncbi:MAG: MotA/TolQ/ExbB proton channel family protein [Lentihominibacter sp.]